jgi:hypothetical protein
MDNKDLPGITNETIKVTLKEEYFNNSNIIGEGLKAQIERSNKTIYKPLTIEDLEKFTKSFFKKNKPKW